MPNPRPSARSTPRHARGGSIRLAPGIRHGVLGGSDGRGPGDRAARLRRRPPRQRGFPRPARCARRPGIPAGGRRLVRRDRHPLRAVADAAPERRQLREFASPRTLRPLRVLHGALLLEALPLLLVVSRPWSLVTHTQRLRAAWVRHMSVPRTVGYGVDPPYGTPDQRQPPGHKRRPFFGTHTRFRETGVKVVLAVERLPHLGANDHLLAGSSPLTLTLAVRRGACLTRAALPRRRA